MSQHLIMKQMRAFSSLPRHGVQPGDLYLARTPMILQTILGSCVGVTFWCCRLGIGALCHGVLPKSPPGTGPIEGFRYVDFSIRYLAGQFDALGAARQELKIKLFGGADVLTVCDARIGKPTIGAQNAEVALDVLAKEGLVIQASDLGGNRGRTIHFDIQSGEVLVHRLECISRLEVSAPTGVGKSADMESN